jgi:pimeloyl-ACP methyl ester carboxylesterase
VISLAHAQDSIQVQIWKGQLAADPVPLAADQIPYQIYGSADKPWLVLIHGLGGSMESWRKTAQDLSKDFHVLTYDQRGHGTSPVDRDYYSSSTMANDLLVLLNHLQIDRAHIVGHSMGARTAIRFASLYPDRTGSVILEDMHMMGRRSMLMDFEPLARAIRPLYKPVFASADEFYRIYQPYMQWQHYDDLFNFGWTGRNGEFYLAGRPQTSLEYSQQALQEDLTEPLKNAKSPLLFLAADSYPVLHGLGIFHIWHNRPDVPVIQVKYSDHSIHFSEAKTFEGLVKGFIATPQNPDSLLTSEVFPAKACLQIFFKN